MYSTKLSARLINTFTTFKPTNTQTRYYYNHINYKKYKNNIIIGTIVGTTSSILCYSGLYFYNLSNNIDLLLSR